MQMNKKYLSKIEYQHAFHDELIIWLSLDYSCVRAVRVASRRRNSTAVCRKKCRAVDSYLARTEPAPADSGVWHRAMVYEFFNSNK